LYDVGCSGAEHEKEEDYGLSRHFCIMLTAEILND
jgi:hypothetical protein